MDTYGVSVSQNTTRQGKRTSSRHAWHCRRVANVGAYDCLAAFMECSALGSFDNRNTLSHKAGAPHQGAGKVAFRWDLPSWLALSSHGFSSGHVPLVALFILVKTLVLVAQGQTCIIPFNLNYLFEDPIPKCSHTGG